MRLANPFHLIKLFLLAEHAFHYGKRKDIEGLEFAKYGKRLGWQLLLKNPKTAIPIILTPVNIVRYFEFSFVYSCLPPQDGRWLDVSSPRLFSCYTAQNRKLAHIDFANPDKVDYRKSKKLFQMANIQNVEIVNRSIDLIKNLEAQWDTIWAISVIEHIDGEYTDREAIQWMYRAIKPGGRLIITFPVDRAFRVEYRSSDPYGIGQTKKRNEYFFQRHYDASSLQERLLNPIGKTPSRINWFGEKERGSFASYEKRWIEEGISCTVQDPIEIANRYQKYSSWEDMPGQGVCGMLIEKGNNINSRTI